MFKKKKQVIKFAAVHPYVELPTPAKKHVPEWYRKTPKYTDGASSPNVKTPERGNLGMKACIPFLDAFITGYTVTLWQDVKVEIVDGVTNFAWSAAPDVLTGRSSEQSFPVPHGHAEGQYVWLIPFIIETPPGYSVLITHPLNRFDLPFTTLSAVVDSDKVLPSGNCPFYLKEGFEGIIEAGTPLYQVIPFKRDDWTSEKDESLVQKDGQRKYDMNRVFSGNYKKNIWSKKNYD